MKENAFLKVNLVIFNCDNFNKEHIVEYVFTALKKIRVVIKQISIKTWFCIFNEIVCDWF